MAISGLDRVPSRREATLLTEDDLQLVQACLQGDTRCFGQLYERYQRQVRATLYQLCGAPQLDDLVQDVFLRAWRGLRGFRQTAKFSTWLYRITWNVAVDQRRRLAKGRSPLPIEESLVQDQLETSPLSRLHYQELVQTGLMQLSWEHRTVVVLHDLEDLPQKEIAAILGIPVGTVKSRLFHARNSLKQFFEQAGIEL